MARRALAAAVLLVLSQAGAAEASARLCRQLETQLAALPAGGAALPSQAKRYDAAIQRQQEQISKARAQSRQAGCGLALFGRSGGVCGEIAATMQRMETNLGELQRQRAKMGGGDNRRERARIFAALDANGCRAPKREAVREAAATSRPAPAAPRHALATSQPALAARNLTGSFRTMCVRTCDGYYFPVSWSVSPAAFERDQNVCRAMCPGTGVELHYHRIAGEESEDMVSAATGLPYRDLPNAFRYRQPSASVPPGCGCDASAMAERGFTVIGGDHGDGIVVQQREDAGVTTAALPPLPSPRPDPAANPEMPASREARPPRKTATPAAKRQAAENGERAVRVVGPTFLPGPEAAIDLQARDQNRAR